jgi:RluA family pseudouridine synthase
MAKPHEITLGDGTVIPILYEDRSVLAIDKPAGWMLAPNTWDRTGRNLQLALESSVAGGEFWARSRNLKFLRCVHRLDAETSGVLLLAKTRGAMPAYSALFESRQITKSYLAVVRGVPKQAEWTCRQSLVPDPAKPGRMKADRSSASPAPPSGKPAETRFLVLKTAGNLALVLTQPVTGRTHQIRVHLAESGFPALHDALYGPVSAADGPLALRAVALAYRDPFTGRPVRIEAPVEAFARRFGFAITKEEVYPSRARKADSSSPSGLGRRSPKVA